MTITHDVEPTEEHPHGPHHELWVFPGDYPHLPGEHGMPEDPDDIVETDIESICGGIDDSQDVEQYDGTLGVTQAFVDAHERPVGQLQWEDDLADRYDDPGNVSGIRWCSGTLIACDLFLTAGHCFDRSANGWSLPKDDATGEVISSAAIATEMHVNFNFQRDPSGNLRTVESFDVVELLEYRLNGLDFAVVRLAGNPGRRFGITRVSTMDAAVGDMLAIIGHPAGVPKVVEAGPLTDLHDDRVGYDSIDTLGGSSGSGILGPNGTIVGVHTNGGCGPASGHNHGLRISSVLAASPIVSDLAANKTVFSDVCLTPKLKFRDDVKSVVDDIKPLLADVKQPLDDFKGLGDKRIDDVKTAAFDPGFALDPSIFALDPARFGLDPARFGVDPTVGAGRRRGATPFVLSTPHHSPAMARAAAAARGATAGGGRDDLLGMVGALSGQLQQLAHQLAELTARVEQG